MLSKINNIQDYSIKLESISKCFHIFKNPLDRIKQALIDSCVDLFLHKKISPYYSEHWALRDINIELKSGEAVGILGHNGAGKSTLLQIIAGTLEPTFGNVNTCGRITALLELGSGFNPEFTGKENAFLNAQILGLSRQDSLACVDEIASFADIGKFINQPIKTYSSGMLMRLAFSVQTVLEPNILIVDEALSVGDAKFQEKCFRKLESLRQKGTTILFVSHDINTITGFCDRAMLMHSGRILVSGSPREVAKIYIKSLYDENFNHDHANVIHKRFSEEKYGSQSSNSHSISDRLILQNGLKFGNKCVEILSVEICGEDGRNTTQLESTKRYKIIQTVVANDKIINLSTGFIIRNTRGIEIFGITNKTANVSIPDMFPGDILKFSIEIEAWLAAGDYFLQAANAGSDGTQYDCHVDALHFTVTNTPCLFKTSIINLNPKIDFQLKAKNSEHLAENNSNMLPLDVGM